MNGNHERQPASNATPLAFGQKLLNFHARTGRSTVCNFRLENVCDDRSFESPSERIRQQTASGSELSSDAGQNDIDAFQVSGERGDDITIRLNRQNLNVSCA
jgi:hypothetical protein